jgi:hypothetical protein
MYGHVKLRQTLLNDTEAAQQKVLLKFFELMFDQTGNRRPTHYNGFPPDPRRVIA